MSSEADRLTSQLMFLPKIIGNLGINIAKAQRELDANYLDGVGRLMQLIRGTLGQSRLDAAKVVLSQRQAEVAKLQAALEKADDSDKPAIQEKIDAAEAAVAKAQEAVANADETPVANGHEFATALQGLIESLAPSRYQYTETTLDFSADLAETMDRNYQVGVGVGLQAVMINAAYSQGFGYDYRAAARITTVLHAISPNESVTNSLLSRAKDIRASALSLPDRSEVEQRVWDRVGTIYDALTGEKIGTGEEGGDGAAGGGT